MMTATWSEESSASSTRSRPMGIPVLIPGGNRAGLRMCLCRHVALQKLVLFLASHARRVRLNLMALVGPAPRLSAAPRFPLFAAWMGRLSKGIAGVRRCVALFLSPVLVLQARSAATVPGSLLPENQFDRWVVEGTIELKVDAGMTQPLVDA